MMYDWGITKQGPAVVFITCTIMSVTSQYINTDNRLDTRNECLSCLDSPCRKVTGLFTRPQLPLGYNMITTIPAKSCNVSIKEVARSLNFLAIKSSTGYIINGDWSIAPDGRYMGAGTGFIYSRSVDRISNHHRDIIYSPGPLQIPVDIMLIYQGRNPGIHYEYWHPVPAIIPDHIIPPLSFQARRRNTRRREGKRRRKNRFRHNQNFRQNKMPLIHAPTEYNNHLEPAFNLPKQGGGGYSLEDDSIFNQIPPIPRGDQPIWKIWKFTPCSKTCGGGSQEAVFICTRQQDEVLDDSQCLLPKPQSQIIKCNPRPCPPTWQIGEWSPCSVTCGTGLASRSWTCVQEISSKLTQAIPNSMCTGNPPRVTLTQPCTLAPCTRWHVSSWKQCSVECGTGVRSRDVTCRAEGVKVVPSQCNAQEKPPAKELCHGHACSTHTWFFTDWSKQCIGGCENGVQTRKVWCSPGINSVQGECDIHYKPHSERPCSTDQSCAAAWFTGPWSPCSSECGNGTKTREVVCVVFLKGSFRATLDIECDHKSRPDNKTFCNPNPCPPHWYYTEWTKCSRTCGGGRKSRAVQCLDAHQKPSLKCLVKNRPALSKPCNTKACPLPEDGTCVDRFINCRYVKKARLCSYYSADCCASCRGLILAG